MEKKGLSSEVNYMAYILNSVLSSQLEGEALLD